MAFVGDSCDDEVEGAWPGALIAQLHSEPTKRLEAAKELAEGAIHLHDGKDYVDDALPQLEKVLSDTSVPCLERCYVALCIARLLAHAWDWDPKRFESIVALSSRVLHDSTASIEAKSIAVKALEQIFEPDNDSETEQEDKSVGKIIKVLAKYFVPQPQPTAVGKKQKQSDAEVVAYMVNLLSPLLSCDCPELVENASSLLSHMPQPKKRSRGDAQSPLCQLVDRLEQLVAAGGGGGAALQVAGVLKGLLKTTIEAAFEVVNDVCDEDLEHLPSVQPYLLRLYAAVPRVLDIPGKDGVTFDDVVHEGEEKCPNKHFGLAAAVLATLYAIRSGPSRTTDGGDPSRPVLLPAEIHKFLLAWRAHRYHVGNEFEMVEHCAGFVAKRNEATWKSCNVVMEMPWTCIRDPFEPQQPAAEGGRDGFIL